jgi:hypothetical protein
MAYNVPAVTDVFLRPIKETAQAVSRARKNVAEQNRAEGASPNTVLRSLAAEGGVLLQSCYVPLVRTPLFSYI